MIWRPACITFKVNLPVWFDELQQPEESLPARTLKRPRPTGPLLFHERSALARRGQLPTHPAADMDGRDEDVVYVKAFATTPQQQPAVARAANELIAEQQARMQAESEVLTSTMACASY